MNTPEILLAIIAVFLFWTLLELGKISARLRQHFPTDKEARADWLAAGEDPPESYKKPKNTEK